MDQIRAQDSEQPLEENIRDLVERLKQQRYRAKLVKRYSMPKGNGQRRPLGMPAVEDKLLQVAVTRLREALYEQNFLRCRYGYRPGVGAVEAVDNLTGKLQFGHYPYVVEADLKGFFDTLDQDWMIRRLAERIDDRAFLGLIRKWLQAGILDTTGAIIPPVTGTPQGGVLSPVLSHVYLHYVLDVWFEKGVKPQCRGEACLLRDADAYVCAFEYQGEAARCSAALGPRLEKVGLPQRRRRPAASPSAASRPQGRAALSSWGVSCAGGRSGREKRL